MFLVNRLVSKSGAVERLSASFSLITLSFSGWVANSIARASYSLGVLVMSYGRLTALRRLAATLLAKDFPMQVKTGIPILSASLEVVCAL